MSKLSTEQLEEALRDSFMLHSVSFSIAINQAVRDLGAPMTVSLVAQYLQALVLNAAEDGQEEEALKAVCDALLTIGANSDTTDELM